MSLIVIEADELRTMLAELITLALADGGATSSTVTMPTGEHTIEPGRLYTAKRANSLLGFGERMTIYEIPETDLPKCRVGPARGSTRYLGADLLAYARGLPAPDLAPMLERARADLEDRLSTPGRVTGTVGQAGKRRRVV